MAQWDDGTTPWDDGQGAFWVDGVAPSGFTRAIERQSLRLVDKSASLQSLQAVASAMINVVVPDGSGRQLQLDFSQ